MDRLCPKCGQRFRADVAYCPVHRVSLVDDPFIGRSLGPYTIKSYLGSGAMGIVYRADPPAAIKILNVVRARMQPELVRRFELEASAISRLENPHTVRLYDAGTTGDGHLYITMELLGGRTFDEILRARRQLDPREAADVIHQAAAALGEAHEKWIVHRDVKPDNLFIEGAEDGRPFVRVLDFGVVRINTESVARSITGTVAGTPAYMSPEQLKSEKDIDGRTDIYSLGVVLYQALSGRNPFQGEGLMQTIQRHLYKGVPPLPEGIPAPLAELTMQMLAKNRDERPTSMADVQARLAWMGLVGPPAVRLPVSPPDGSLPPLTATPLSERGPDPAFQRARQITPVARPVEPVPADPLPLDPLPPDPALALGDTVSTDPDADPDAPAARIVTAAEIAPALAALTEPPAAEPAPRPRPASAPPADDPWRSTAPPAARPSIDLAPIEPPPSAPPDVAAIPDLAPDPITGLTWADDPLDAPLPPPHPDRRRALAVVGIFALGAGVGAWLSGNSDAADAAPDPDAPALRDRARAAIARRDWDAAIDALDSALAAAPADPELRALRATATAERAARESWHELLDAIAAEQWQAAEHRIERFPTTSVYHPGTRALRALVDDGRARSTFEDASAHALAGDWRRAARLAETLAARPTPPAGLDPLRAAIGRQSYTPSPYTRHLLDARHHMHQGDWRLALTRLGQAAETADAGDTLIPRRRLACSRALGDTATALEHALAWRETERDLRYAPVIDHAIDALKARLDR